ncbi:MAG: hypothetical protein JKX80_01890, partial [Candidatus Pacebacteria bacterium]|nr:hypothetical protein [Candidatus Paceibacterota bacterium]
FVVANTDFVPPVAGAIQAILEEHHVSLAGTKAVIIGKGRLVGAPVRTIFEHGGADITIIDTNTKKKTSKEAIQAAKIIVSGVGIPNLVTHDQISKGVVLIDAGTSSTKGTLSGDICLDCIPNASLVSKTPGGVGPITVAILFRNLVRSIYK